jgi:hypothetical protein
MASMRWTDGTRAARRVMAIDLLALPLFVIVGMGSHDEDRVGVFLRNAVPLEAAWLAVSLVVRTYRPPTFRTFIVTWAIAVPVGLVVRTVLADRFGDDGMWVFFGVALAFTLLFLAVGRGLALFLERAWGSS